jgi:hypothetical protein
VLRYHRPIQENGTMTYEFLYNPGKSMVHPVLGKLAFLLEPDGVKLHRLTDTLHGPARLDPANAVDDPSCRRGPDRLPLKTGEWNRLALRATRDGITIILNDVEIFARKVELTDDLTFGFFHFADQTEARIREVSYAGKWSKAVPTRKLNGSEQ